MGTLNILFAFGLPAYVVAYIAWKRWEPYVTLWAANRKALQAQKRVARSLPPAPFQPAPPGPAAPAVAAAPASVPAAMARPPTPTRPVVDLDEVEPDDLEEDDDGPEEDDEEVERILALTDEEVLAEVRAEGGDPEADAARMREAAQEAIARTRVRRATIDQKWSSLGFGELAPPQPADPFKWLDDLLLRTIHLMVLGGTGAGKTLLLQQIARMLVRMEHAVIVCDPDAAAGDWQGSLVYGAGDAFDQIERALQAVRQEATKRRAARAEGMRDFPHLWLILEEYSDIKDECDSASSVVENLLRRARKLNIHVLIGVQDNQVKTLGWERKSALLTNVKTVTLELNETTGVRTARLDGGTSYLVPRIAIPAAGPGSPTPENRLGLTEIPGKTAAIPESGLEIPAESATDPDEEDNDDPDDTDNKDAAISGLLSLGWSYSRISKALGVSTTRIARVVKSSRLEV